MEACLTLGSLYSQVKLTCSFLSVIFMKVSISKLCWAQSELRTDHFLGHFWKKFCNVDVISLKVKHIKWLHTNKTVQAPDPKVLFPLKFF